MERIVREGVTALLHGKLIGIVVVTTLLLVVGVALIALPRVTTMTPTAAIQPQESQVALQVPSPEQTVYPTIDPQRTPTIYATLPASPNPPPFPSYPVPTWTSVPIGSDDEAFLTPIVPTYVPPSTVQPETPYHQTVSFTGWSNAELATTDATVIVNGTVKRVGSARWTTPDGKRPANPWAPDNKYTIFRPIAIHAGSYLKGSESKAELLVMAGGGVVGLDSVDYHPASLYTFREGERVLVFLRKSDHLMDNSPLWWLVGYYFIAGEDAINAYNNERVPLQQLLSEVREVLTK
jgi:hypothetical protein